MSQKDTVLVVQIQNYTDIYKVHKQLCQQFSEFYFEVFGFLKNEPVYDNWYKLYDNYADSRFMQEQYEYEVCLLTDIKIYQF